MATDNLEKKPYCYQWQQVALSATSYYHYFKKMVKYDTEKWKIVQHFLFVGIEIL